ncbi:hypothetical protein PENANT_c002G02665 [Penicillium antarcticum]|uniref:Uncharacterized protein n=2 Tax=Penicillium antarcticum TaxID=416450 RepID=A0A1V6QKE4_9EURO|nr:hypothetical protein PENANT_c002G02665 [Penicillium antarcticum]
MAAPKAQSQSAGASKGTGDRRTTRFSSSKQGLEEMTKDGKRKPVQYEEDDGFQFSRKPSKKSRPSIEAVPENPNLDIENAPPKATPRRGRPPKKRPEDTTGSSGVPVKGTSVELPSRKPTRGFGRTYTESEAQPATVTRSSHPRDSPEHEPGAKKPRKGRPPKAKAPETNGYQSPEQPPAGTKVALPTADTPVIQRNKELRGGKGEKKGRRSSLSRRGRRASDLIDSGTSNALPHREVSVADFYKHIADEGLPEPRRMRQLLIWCATRALGDKPSGGSNSDDQSARLAARVIQEELLREFSSNSELSNWFSREEVNPPAVIVKKPNPRNVQNTEKIKELEEHIQKLQKERQSLNAILRQPVIPSFKSESRPEQQKTTQSSQKTQREEVDFSLLDPSQQAILRSLNPPTPSEEESSTTSSTRPPMTPSAISSQLSRITTGLAPTLDAFAAGVHDIELYRASADIVSSRVLRICSQRLEERDAHNTQSRLAIEGGDKNKPPDVPRPREDLGLILGALSRLERR